MVVIFTGFSVPNNAHRFNCAVMATPLDEEILREAEGEEDFEYYSLLNVDRGATQEEIRSAYRRLCRVYHPDR